MTLNHYEQEIDLSGAHQTKILDHAAQQWHLLTTDFSRAVPINYLISKFPLSREQMCWHIKKYWHVRLIWRILLS